MKNVFTLGLFLILSTQIIFAQKHKHHYKSKFSAEHKAELKTHFAEIMYPVLKQAHEKMEQSLSPEELSIIQEQRIKKNELKKKMKALRQTAKNYREEGKTQEEIREILGQEKKRLHKERKAIHEALLPILKNNVALVESLKNDLASHHQQWREEKDAIHAKYLTTEEIAQHKEKRQAHKEKLEARKGAENVEKYITYKKAVKFMLWDGQLPTSHDKEAYTTLSSNTEGFSSVSDGLVLHNYPNPLIDLTTISFELPQKANMVALLITDTNGKIIQDINLGSKSSGTHTLEFNAKELSSGQYFYILDVDGQQFSRSMIKQ
ncbi:MAG: T9SS type A sorting domain-containing protein [Saprospiraceae bacterium]|nr:T9SS type A sorting domain-containing protein [Saprospiraceae bacterium]